MNSIMRLATTSVFLLFACFLINVQSSNCYGNNTVINSITGQVFGPNRTPVPDVYVELQNDFYSTISRVKTSRGGQFAFTGMRGGAYQIKVDAFGTNYISQTQRVEVVNIFPGSSDSVYIDIYLKVDQNKVNTGFSGINEVIFVQEIPEEASDLYKKGLKQVNKKNEDGFADIQKALEIFPTYYDALNFLGTQYVQRNQYEKSLPYLVKAVEINQKSFSSFYALAYACYKLGYKPEAIEAARAATILQPSSINAQILYGTVLILDGSYEKAEAALLQAKKLGKENPVGEIFWQLALIYNKRGKNKEAADNLELYIKYSPDIPNKAEVTELIKKLRSKETKTNAVKTNFVENKS